MKTVNDNRKMFVEWTTSYEKQKKEAEKQFSRISTMRILTFLLGTAGLIIGISEKKTGFLILGAVFLVLFFILVKLHSTIAKKQETLQYRWEVCKRYLDRYTDKWRKFHETGNVYKTESDCVSEDIDLLGENSLYQMLSVCHTEKGKKKLAAHLTERFVSETEREKRHDAIMELVENPQFAVDFETAGMEAENKPHPFQPDEFEQFCRDEKAGKLPLYAQIVRFLFPACELLAIVLFLCGVISYGYALIGFLVLLVFSWLTKTKTDAVILPVYYASAVSGEYETMLALIAGQKFESDMLVKMQEHAGGEHGAVTAYRKLKTISQAYNISFNPLIHQLLCGLFLWDYQLAAVTAHWKKCYGAQVAGCSDMIGNLEELLSFAVLGMVRHTGESRIFYDEQNVTLTGTNLYHPLLLPEQAQGNSVTLSSGITIITGSNMSGKTTFLRTIAVNLVLAYLGAPVCAKYLTASYMRIFTSMRVRDDVSHGISTFYAEILRIKEMAEYRKEKKPMICLIDEIFKGTNSADRIVGAKEVIKKLAGKICMTVVSTHDFELCSITDRDQTPAVNFHFQEYYEGDELRFDYKIREGRCTTTNARAILRMAGFEV